MSADRPRFVLDTVVPVSAALFSASTPRRAVTVARMQGDLLLSTALFRELRDVFSRPKIDRNVPVEARIEFLLELERTSLFVPIRETVQACRDTKDDRVLEGAVNGGAACIASSAATMTSWFSTRSGASSSCLQPLSWSASGCSPPRSNGARDGPHRIRPARGEPRRGSAGPDTGYRISSRLPKRYSRTPTKPLVDRIRVVNASPLITLAKVGRLDLLSARDVRIVIPNAVEPTFGGRGGLSPLSGFSDAATTATTDAFVPECFPHITRFHGDSPRHRLLGHRRAHLLAPEDLHRALERELDRSPREERPLPRRNPAAGSDRPRIRAVGAHERQPPVPQGVAAPPGQGLASEGPRQDAGRGATSRPRARRASAPSRRASGTPTVSFLPDTEIRIHLLQKAPHRVTFCPHWISPFPAPPS